MLGLAFFTVMVLLFAWSAVCIALLTYYSVDQGDLPFIALRPIDWSRWGRAFAEPNLDARVERIRRIGIGITVALLAAACFLFLAEAVSFTSH